MRPHRQPSRVHPRLAAARWHHETSWTSRTTTQVSRMWREYRSRHGSRTTTTSTKPTDASRMLSRRLRRSSRIERSDVSGNRRSDTSMTMSIHLCLLGSSRKWFRSSDHILTSSGWRTQSRCVIFASVSVFASDQSIRRVTKNWNIQAEIKLLMLNCWI